jgi:hypothetical protein
MWKWRGKMKIKIAVLTLALFTLISIGSSKASTYNLVLDSSNGSAVGNGSFSVSGTITNTVSGTFTPTSLDFSIDGDNFTLSNALSSPIVTFDKGVLVSIAYLGSMNGFSLDLGTLGLGYVFADLSDPSLGSIGSISASATPLPPSWTLMLIGLAGAGFVAHRRKGKMLPATA